MCEPGRDSPATTAVFPQGVQVSHTIGAPKTRTVTKVAVEGLTNEVFFYNNTLVNLERALAERVFNVEGSDGFRPPPQPETGAFGRLGPFKEQLLRHCGRATRITSEQFVGMYTGRKATMYQAAVDSLQLRPVNRRDSYVSTFVKAEKVIATPSKPWPAPRAIQPRSYRYNVEVGRFLKPLESKVYNGISKVWGEPVVMKGYTVEGVAAVLRGKWEAFRDPVAVGLDASRFDQHVSTSALEWEHSVYTGCFHGNDRTTLRRLLQWQLENKGFASASNGKIKYAVRGCRMSGDMNTALGNCLLMCALVWLYLQERGLLGKLVNNGDDCVVILERADLGRFNAGLVEWFLTFGFTMKVEKPTRTFEEIEFCRMQPVQTAGGWVMVRTPGPGMQRDLTTLLSVPNEKMARKWLYAIGAGGAAITHGVPVYSVLYQQMIALGIASDVSKDTWLGDTGFMRLRSNRTAMPITPEARHSFWLAFGVTPDAQEELEKIQLNCVWAPGVSSKAGITYNTLLND